MIARGRLGDDGFGNGGTPSSPNVQFYPREEDPEPTQFVLRQQWLDKKWINRGSIFNVRVGPGLLAEGFFGDIESRLGRIYSVRSTGEIVGVQIKAADGVLEVRIIDWSQGSDAARVPLEKDLRVVSIIAAEPNGGVDFGPSVQKIGNDVGDGYEETISKARLQGAIHLIETKGSFSGTVKCVNLIDAGDDRPDLRDSRGRSGVIVWDGLTEREASQALPGPVVDVEHLAHNVCVLSPDIAWLRVGWQFKGAAVAYGNIGPYAINTNDQGAFSFPRGVNNGVINELEIGWQAREDRPELPSNERYVGMIPGFVGGWQPPLNLDPADPMSIDDTLPPLGPEWFPARRYQYDNDRWLWASPLASPTSPEEYLLDGGCLDSVIKAEILIDRKTTIFAMHQRIFVREGHKSIEAWRRPRVESPIVHWLTIPRDAPIGFDHRFYDLAGMFEGVAWSGKTRYVDGGGGAIRSDYASVQDYFASLGDVIIHRMGPGADVWHNESGVTVYRDMAGEVHHQGMQARIGVIIGGRLSTLSEWPYPWYRNNLGGLGDDPAEEPTPRGRAMIDVAQRENDFAHRGAVFSGLNGQGSGTAGGGSPIGPDSRFEGAVMINTGNGPAGPDGVVRWDGGVPVDHTVAWRGFVRVGDPWDDPTRVITLGPSDTVGVAPLPDPVLDVARLYKRHSWELSGAESLVGQPQPSVPIRIASRMGGGVGVMPYALHLEDCSPPLLPGAVDYGDPFSYHALDAQVWIDRWPPRSIIGVVDPLYGALGVAAVRMRFYGPVLPSDTSSSDLPFVVSKGVRNAATGTYTWTELLTGEHFFEYLHDREFDVLVGPKCFTRLAAGTYRVTRRPVESALNRLGCTTFVQIAGESPEEFTWYLRLTYPCADIAGSGGVEGPDGEFDNNDFIVFIDWLFAQDERADIGVTGGVPGSDGVWDNNDFVVFIDWLFNGTGTAHGQQLCPVFAAPGECPQGGIAPPPEGLNGGEPPVGQSNSTSGDRAAAIRAALEAMISNEPDAARRAQLRQMLDALPQGEGGAVDR